jgi:sugar phosphate isomerase/epimerase
LLFTQGEQHLASTLKKKRETRIMTHSPVFGIQSWCFRHFKTIPEFARELERTGVTASEVCGVQVDYNKPETFDDAIAAFKKEGVKILSIGVQGLTGKDSDRNYFEFCRKAGCRFMSVNFSPEGMWDHIKAAEKLAEEYDLRLGIHNHGGKHWLGNAAMLEYIFKHTGKRIGLTLDTAWAIDAHCNPVEMAQKFADRLVGVHVKDFTYTPDHKPQDVIIGRGILDLPALTSTLQKNGFDGFTVIEYEADVQNPVPALSECVQVLSRLVG